MKSKKTQPQQMNIHGIKLPDSFGIIGPAVACLLLFGMIFCCALMLSLSAWQVIIMLAVGVAAVAANVVVGRKLKKLKLLAALMLIAAAALLTLIDRNGVIGGAEQFANSVINLWNTEYSDAASLVSVSSGASITMFAIAFTLTAAALCCFVTYIRKPFAVLLTAFAVIVAMLILGAFSAVSCALLISAVFGARLFYSLDGSAAKRSVSLAAFAAIAICAALLLNNVGIGAIDSARQNAKQTVHNIRYGEALLPEGDLSEAYTMNQSVETALTVKQTLGKTLYLRSFVGANYSDGSWSGLTRAAFRGDNSGIEDWLEENGFSSASQLAAYYSASGETTPGNKVTVTVENADREYYYIPSSAEKPDDSAYQEKDSGYLTSGLFGKSEYSFVELSNGQPSELLHAADWVSNPTTDEQEQYVENEAIYRTFVYENYLEINEDLADYINKIFVDTAEDEDLDGIYHATAHIRSVLEEVASYTDSPDKAAGDEDPIYAFLNGEPGNSAMYASAAVEAYRAMGIPARYAEGYYLDNETSLDDNGVTELTGSDAHAWVEVYMDGLGWLPIDVTPGYYYDTYALMEMVDKPSEIKQTAALEDDGESADTLPESQGRPEKPADKKLTAGSVALIGTGIVAALIILAALTVLIFELRRVYYAAWLEKNFDKLSPIRRQSMLCFLITWMLNRMSIDACVGWRASDVEDTLRERFGNIYEGEYLRINQLTEKLVYGGEQLRPEEERVLVSFVDKLSQAERSLSFRQRFRLRFAGRAAVKFNSSAKFAQ